ncbi:hypothetical protein AB7M22_001416 [Pseudomonas sp. ADAK2 TE3594]
MDVISLKTQCEALRSNFLTGQKAWSAAHHAVTFGGILCSLGAIIFIQIQAPTWATLSTALAASLAGMATAGGFERKWRRNRISRSKIDGLLIDLGDESVDLHSAAAELKNIILQHDEGIVTPTPVAGRAR